MNSAFRLFTEVTLVLGFSWIAGATVAATDDTTAQDCEAVQILGVAGVGLVSVDPDSVPEEFYYELRDATNDIENANFVHVSHDAVRSCIDSLFAEIIEKRDADTVIFFELARLDMQREGLQGDELEYVEAYVGLGVVGKILHGKDADKWRRKHPRRKPGDQPEFEVLENDARWEYRVIGVARVRIRSDDVFDVDDALKEDSRRSLKCRLASGCDAVIFARYRMDFYSGWGVMIKYQ